MKIKFKVEKKDFKILRKIFEDYVKSRYHPTSSTELYTGDFGANGRITRDCITINLCTGNTWRCYINNIPNAFEINGYFVEYEGSRAGLHALTPFRFYKKFIDAWVTENDLNIIIRDRKQTKTLTLTVVGFKTSFPELKWSEKVEKLAEQPEKAVVLTWENIPLRVINYKNVYKKGE
jgi:hypothetical protein